MAQYARPIPATMTALSLGVDVEDLPKFMVWSDHLIWGIIGVLSNEERAQVATSILEFQEYMEPLIADRSTIQCSWRRTTEDTDVEGTTIPGNVMVAPLWGAAKRIPRCSRTPTPSICIARTPSGT